MMLVRLDSVPPGAQLEFTYGPTTAVLMSWALSAGSLLAMLVWLIRPRWFSRGWFAVRRGLLRKGELAKVRVGWSEKEDD